MGCCCGKTVLTDTEFNRGELDNENGCNNCPLLLSMESVAGEEEKELPSKALAPSEMTTMTAAAITNAQCLEPQKCGTCENELSDTIICSSTTVDDVFSDRFRLHRRVETAASGTWPEVSMPTASVLYEHPRTFSEFDTEEDFSQVEQSTASLRERRLLFIAREREKAVVREMMITEGEKRHAIIDFCNTGRRAMAFRFYRGILAIERRVMLIGFLTGRAALLLRVTEAQETIGRRLTENEWQTGLLSKMQQHRVGRRRSVVASVEGISSNNNNNNNKNNGNSSNEPIEASPAVCSEEEKALMPAAVAAASTTTVGRSLSAPSSFWRSGLQQNSSRFSLSPSLPPRPYQRHSGNCSVHTTVAEVIRPLHTEQKEVLHRQQRFSACHVMKKNASGTERLMNCKSNGFPAAGVGVGGLH
ncbi:hypothetical protein MOQ_003785 [Trypanosoma cruzi marinkellei]|uniref:Uncharacterized protein n=1 Tax=Trypanosoma cruzi marinkellei TaxID=85056 RepID=K2N343_TRYCR|nr:hypothetical protein MOQ_003785 [Trypanosoma cruzi marinkellei]